MTRNFVSGSRALAGGVLARRVLVMGALSCVGIASSQGCASSFGTPRSEAHLVVTIQKGNLGTADAPNPLSFDTPAVFTVRVEAHRPDGTLDTDFNGYVRFTSKPGTVISGSGDDKSVRNAQLAAGVADGVTVSVLGAYGKSRLWAEDLGFIPGDPTKNPQCADGIDNNGNGLIDYPSDPGCEFANDDTEDGGSYAGGVSDPIYFVAPRVADVRGVVQGGAATSFPHEQVQVDTGFRDGQYAFNTVVTRVSADGFYVTDLADADTAHGGRGYASVFAFNFSAPPGMRICDRIKSLGGTSSDFNGFTEINYPTWTLEEWDPTARPCLVPEPTLLNGSALNTGASAQPLLNLESSLVRVATISPSGSDKTDINVHIGAKLGPDRPAYVLNPDGTYNFTIGDNATSCDLNRDGKVDFTAGGPESACSNACVADIECSEYTNYKARNQFRIVLSDKSGGGTPNVQSILADASASAEFDPLASKGTTLHGFTGALRYFSGGSQNFTIEARCIDDIIVDLKTALNKSDSACVHARTIIDVNAGSN